MGFLDELKEKAGDLGGKAREGLEAAKEKASGLVGDVRERFDSGDTPASDATGSADDLVGDETYFGETEASAPQGPVDDLGAAAAGAAGTTEAADTMSPVDVGAAVSAADLDATDSGVAPGEAPSVGDVAEPPGFVDAEPGPTAVETGGLNGLGGASETSATFSDASTGLGEEPQGESGFSADEVSGGLQDSRDDALDAVQAENEEIQARPDQP